MTLIDMRMRKMVKINRKVFKYSIVWVKFKNGPKVQRAIIRLECDELFEKNEIKLLQKKNHLKWWLLMGSSVCIFNQWQTDESSMLFLISNWE